jgi:hypothetical protein
MNLGIYVDSLGNTEQLKYVSNIINTSVGSMVDDASIFFDGISHIPFDIKCGLFNSTDLWNFDGCLITMTLDNAFMATKIVNNIDLYYYYNWESSKNTLRLIELLKNNVKVICRNKNDEKNLYRITGQKALGISENFNNIVNIIVENSDGRFKNRENVCRSS